MEVYRQEIDRIDRAITELFLRRMAVAEQIARYKQANGLPIYDAAREAQKLRYIRQSVPQELRAETEELYQLLFALSRRYQERITEEHHGTER